jgi:hypothetical protein
MKVRDYARQDIKMQIGMQAGFSCGQDAIQKVRKLGNEGWITRALAYTANCI